MILSGDLQDAVLGTPLETWGGSVSDPGKREVQRQGSDIQRIKLGDQSRLAC